MILLLGASGFIGRAFASELRRRGMSFIPLTRQAFDYSRFEYLFDYVRTMRPDFVINATGYSCQSAVRPETSDREKMMAIHVLLPQVIANVCALTKTPWGHVSSGEIYAGAKVVENGQVRIELDLKQPWLHRLFEESPDSFHGFTERDEPNFSFGHQSANYYSGTRALGEATIRESGDVYIWRARLPFDESEEPCNYLRQLQQKAVVQDQISSLSHVSDFVKAAIDLWEMEAPFGTYNITNPGAVTTRQVVDGLQRALRNDVRINFEPGPAQAEAPDGHCILDTTKLLKAGIKMRPISEALGDCLEKIRVASRAPRPQETAPGYAVMAEPIANAFS